MLKFDLKLCLKQNMEQVNTDIKMGTIFVNFENNKTSEPLFQYLTLLIN